jgi:cell division protein FtsW
MARPEVTFLSPGNPGPDRVLALGVLGLLLFGLVMVTSSSLQIAESASGEPLHYSLRQGIYLLLGITLTACTYMLLPLAWLEKMRFAMLPLVLAALLAVFIPGLGHEVNGSLRWIKLGGFTLQPSELIKPAFVLYVAGYIAQHKTALEQSWKAFLVPLGVFAVIAVLLLLQPDFGAVVLLACVLMGMLFLAGVPIPRFLIVTLAGAAGVAVLAFAQPYRVQRLLSFMNPWQEQFGGGYQLTQSLIAFGRGDILGVGLGNSVQKLFYLPEAHTDFVHAVVAEEFGLVGNLALMMVFALVCYRIFWLGSRLQEHGSLYAAFVVYGVALMFSAQIAINLGVNMGLLPTKGLTLPFVSYGGSSLVASFLMVGLVLRAVAETRFEPGSGRAKS